MKSDSSLSHVMPVNLMELLLNHTPIDGKPSVLIFRFMKYLLYPLTLYIQKAKAVQ